MSVYYTLCFLSAAAMLIAFFKQQDQQNADYYSHHCGLYDVVPTDPNCWSE
ncbi:Uncharacterised protein [Vibrio mimicus]|nr:Uncharacterised protein [Vibrio mimicus]